MLKQQRSYRTSKGDTIVEVLFAVAIFSAIAIASLSVMNRSIGLAQRSLEVSLVRQEMDTQAQILRFAHEAYISGDRSGPGAVWENVKKEENVILSTQLASLSSLITTCAPPTQKAFVIDPVTVSLKTNSTGGQFIAAPVYSRIKTSGSFKAEGIWVQQLKGSSGGEAFRDFHIRACWHAPGGNTPVTLGTIVRLHDA